MQNHVHPHYTLPGIMHYLQTEFTKNERDRITWQLERLEMKSYITKLEGENKDLKRRILELEQRQQAVLPSNTTQTTNTNKIVEPTDKVGNKFETVPDSTSGSGSSGLLRAKLTVQENVREIIQLLNSPNIASQLEGFSDKSNLSHDMERLNFNTGEKQRVSREAESSNKNHGVMVNSTEIGVEVREDEPGKTKEVEEPEYDDRKDNVAASKTIDAAVQGNDIKPAKVQEQIAYNGSSEGGENTGIINDREVSNVSTGLRREETLTLDDDDDIEPDLKRPNTNVDSAKRQGENVLESRSEATLINEYLNSSQDICDNKNGKPFLKTMKNNILVTLDGELRLYRIADDNNNNDDNDDDDDTQCFDTGMKFDDLDLRTTKDIFWLDEETIMALSNSGEVKIWSIKKQRPINKFNLVHNSEILDFFSTIKATDYKNGHLLATNEEWVFIWKLNGMSDSEVKSIYSTQCGDILDCVFGADNESIVVLRSSSPSLVTYNFEGDVPKVVELEHLGPISEMPQLGKLQLNRETSDLLLQTDLLVTIYSLKQRKIIYQSSLEKLPVSLCFKYTTGLVGIAYSDCKVELRRADDFSSILMSYYCNSESGSKPSLEDASQSSAILIDTVRFEGFEPIILSLCDGNTLKLETMGDESQ